MEEAKKQINEEAKTLANSFSVSSGLVINPENDAYMGSAYQTDERVYNSKVFSTEKLADCLIERLALYYPPVE